MPTVESLLKRLLPRGTAPSKEETSPNWDMFPRWPPDLFAATASLVDHCGCYSHPRYAGGGWGEAYHDTRYVQSIQDVARGWMDLAESVPAQPGGAKDPQPDPIGPNPSLDEIRKRWDSLIRCGDEIAPCDSNGRPPDWCDAATWLLAAADEASAGIGFFREERGRGPTRTNPFVDYWMRQYLIWDCAIYLKKKAEEGQGVNKPLLRSTLTRIFGDAGAEGYVQAIDDPTALRGMLEKAQELPYLTSSLCRMVPRTEACVQPKTRTSGVGCTLRSLSHHLALLPPASQVETRWRVANRYHRAAEADPSGPQSLNLLLVPFPYTISSHSFRGGPPCVGSHGGDWNDEGVNRSKFFSLRQDWLPRGDGSGTPAAQEMAGFLQGLIGLARREADQIHGLILPELALTSELAYGVAELLSRNKDLEIFISGVVTKPRADRGPKNSVFTCIMDTARHDGQAEVHEMRSWEQAKHHRWKVERHQVRRYHLGGQLDPHIDWWEHIDISPRQCYFGVFRDEACLTALVCEDLARIDPVQTVIRSIGPNLVIALLMDGPQVEHRWSGRYATVLAEDPGSSVLTLTSIGLLKRSEAPARLSTCQIALWKEAGGNTIEIHIPADHHALLLTLSYRRENCFTLDGRPDLNRTVSLACTGLYPIKMEPLPEWMTRIPAPSQGEAVPAQS